MMLDHAVDQRIESRGRALELDQFLRHARAAAAAGGCGCCCAVAAPRKATLQRSAAAQSDADGSSGDHGIHSF